MKRKITVRIDSSGVTHLAVCRRCSWVGGPTPTREEAVSLGRAHTREHRDEYRRDYHRAKRAVASGTSTDRVAV